MSNFIENNLDLLKSVINSYLMNSYLTLQKIVHVDDIVTDKFYAGRYIFLVFFYSTDSCNILNFINSILIDLFHNHEKYLTRELLYLFAISA